MENVLTWSTLLTGTIILLARVADVSLGTVRTISIVHGRTVVAFVLGFVEISIWLVVIASVIDKIASQPILGVFYALGFSTGNVVGIKLEKWLAFGFIVLKVISLSKGKKMAEKVREAGFAVTTFLGEGKTSPVTELYIVCRRRDLRKLLPLVNSIEPGAFYFTEGVGEVSKVYRPLNLPVTGWRSILKKK